MTRVLCKEKNETKMPCRECLVFPICKAQVTEFIDSFKTPPVANKLFLAYRGLLIKKCELIYKWMDSEFNANGGYGGIKYKFIINRMNEAYKHEFKG